MDDFIEAILTECEAREIERITGRTRIDSTPDKLIWRVYDRAFTGCRFGSKALGLSAVYLLGYIYGVRAERKKRRRVG